MSEPLLKVKCVRAFEEEDHATVIELLPSLQGHNDVIVKCYGDDTFLVHAAATIGWLNVVQTLVTQYGCDPDQRDSACGYTALHYAAANGHHDVVTYLVVNCHCNVNAKDNYGTTPLHYVAVIGHLTTTRVLVEHGADVMAIDDDGVSPLHWACQNNSNNCNIPVIKYLLSIPAVLNSFTKDSSYKSPLSGAEGDAAATYDKFERARVSHPVGSYVNVFFLGNPGAGKTTLCQAIRERSFKTFAQVRNVFVSKKVRKIELRTAGIVPNKLEGDQSLGNIIIHDFAGQSEYYSSHTAVLEGLLSNSGAVFVVVINLTQDLSQQIRFWSSIISNERQKVSSACHLIVIGSHVDKVKVSLQQQITFDLENHFSKEIAITPSICLLDCRLCSSDNLKSFVEVLSRLCSSVRNKQSPTISLYCNFLYSILEEKVSKDNVCTLEHLMLLCDESRQEDVPLPDNIIPLLKTLHSIGLIVYLENKEDPTKSWIVVSKEILLSEVNGILFTPSYFKEHRDIASNTGIITSRTLQQLFPLYLSDMLIAFLKSMKLCEELDETLLKVTNLKLKESDIGCNQLLFFPALMTERRPEHIKKQFKMGWCLTFTSGHSFSIRFLHILLLHLAYRYSRSVSSASPLLPPGLEQQCSVWINGIHWHNDDGVETLVEQMEDNQCVVMLMCCQEGAHAKEKMIQLHFELTKTIVHLQEKYCPILQCREYLLSPKLQYPLDKPSKIVRYDLELLRSRISSGEEFILCMDATNQEATAISELLPIKPSSYLKMYKETVCDGITGHDDRASGPPTLNELLDVLSEVDWYMLGVRLDISTGALDNMKEEHPTVQRRLVAMLQKWLSMYPRKGWHDIINALRKMDLNDVADGVIEKYTT